MRVTQRQMDQILQNVQRDGMYGPVDADFLASITYMPKDRKRLQSEHKEQVMLIEHARSHQYIYPALAMLYAIPNGGYRNKTTARNMKREGQLAGVPDLFLPSPSNGYCGLYVEMKTKYNSTTDEQANFLWYAHNAGYKVAICYGWQCAWGIIREYLDE